MDKKQIIKEMDRLFLEFQRRVGEAVSIEDKLLDYLQRYFTGEWEEMLLKYEELRDLMLMFTREIDDFDAKHRGY